MTANFEQMSMQFDPSAQVSLRRLSTPSYIQEPGNALSTKWIWYWKDNDGWKKYAETKVRILLFPEVVTTHFIAVIKLKGHKLAIFLLTILLINK